MKVIILKSLEEVVGRIDEISASTSTSAVLKLMQIELENFLLSKFIDLRVLFSWSLNHQS